MFCPRCGSPTHEGLKFCRNCGLPITPVSTYVATGGTANLAPQPGSDIEASEYLTPKQKLVLTIALCLLSPAILAVMAEMIGVDGEIAAIPAVLMPVGIIWAVFHYKSVVRRRRAMAAYPMPQQMSFVPPPAMGATPYQHQIPQHQMPQHQMPPHRTNPLLDATRGSIVEDQTKRFPDERN